MGFSNIRHIGQEDEVHESLKGSIKFNGTRYSVKLPWKEGHSALPSNYNNTTLAYRD
jgi:hypothetical protein